MNLPGYYEFCWTGKIISGQAAIEKIPAEMARLGVSHPLLITDKGVRKAGLVERVSDVIRRTEIIIPVIYDEVPADSEIKIVRQVAGLYRENGCDAILAIGGGSVMDTAKAVNILITEHSDDLRNFTGSGALKRRLKPLLVIPTTAGTGSEMTQAAVIADHSNQRKMLFPSQFLYPDVAVLDPRMTATLGAELTAATAMDALTHACEAYTCMQKNPLSDGLALQAIRLISTHLALVLDNPDDLDGRLALANAAAMAGLAFSNSMVGLVHALGHSLGSVCGIHHGVAMAVFLPYGLEYNRTKSCRYIGELFYALAGPQIYSATPNHERPDKTISWIRELNEKLHRATGGKHPRCLKEIRDHKGTERVTKDHFPHIARTCMGDGSLVYSPEDADYNDVITILNYAWDGKAFPDQH